MIWTTTTSSTWTTFLPLAALLLVIGIVAAACRTLRYGLTRRLTLNTLCWAQGRRVVWIHDPGLALRVLQSSSSKGNCLESLVSVPALTPILSLESVDGEQWRRMKKSFLALRARLPPLQLLEDITKEVAQRCLDSKITVDCPVLVRLVCEIMTKWLFNVNLQPPEAEIILAGVEECRKALALKGTADETTLALMIEWIKDTIRKSPFADLFGPTAKWEEPEYWSLILQPFFISPSINMADIGATLASFADTTSEIYSKKIHDHNSCPFVLDRSLLIDAINSSHPFPVLERWFPDGLEFSLDQDKDLATTRDGGQRVPNFLIRPNTHVFIPIDEIGRQLCRRGGGSTSTSTTTSHDAEEDHELNRWAAFGAGKRGCAGQDIALIMASGLFSPLLSRDAGSSRHNGPLFRPQVGNMYSGRYNDRNETLAQNIFQVKVFLRITTQLVKQRIWTVNDTTKKYGFGSVRLLLILCLFSLYLPRLPPLTSLVFYGVFGVGGALLNLHVLSRQYQLPVLSLLATCFILEERLNSDPVLLLYFFKTLLGDFLAGKLDHSDWSRSLTIAVVLWTALSQLSVLPGFMDVGTTLWTHAAPFTLATGAHFLCEIGDSRWEENRFWRHRYSYELTSLVLFFFVPAAATMLWTSTGRVLKQLIFMDAVASFFYRLANFKLIDHTTVIDKTDKT